MNLPSNWTWMISAALGAIGLIGLIYKKTMLGLIVSIQVMVLGAAILFVLSGGEAGVAAEGHSFGVFIVICGLAQVVGGYALATRMFYLKNDATLSELRSLKR
jgi:NADH:ubiquinone oxidoreductase subunit K